MKRTWLLPCLTLLFFCGLSQAKDDIEFVFAYDTQEGFPSFMGNGQTVPDQNPGTYVEILRLVDARLPIKVSFVRLPWNRCKAYLKQNLVSGINSSFRESRKELGVFPSTTEGQIDPQRRITSDIYRIYAKKSSNISYDPLRNRIINQGKGLIAPLGYSIVADLRKEGVEVTEHSGGVEKILRMLALGRAEGAISHQSQTNYLLSRYPKIFDQINPLEPPLSEKNYYILISKEFYRKHPEMAEKIWDTIGELRETHLPSIIARYMAHLKN